MEPSISERNVLQDLYAEKQTERLGNGVLAVEDLADLNPSRKSSEISESLEELVQENLVEETDDIYRTTYTLTDEGEEHLENELGSQTRELVESYREVDVEKYN